MDNFARLKLPGEGKRVSVLGVPLSFGQSMAGVDMGPSAMRVAGLTKRIKKLGYEVKDQDDLEIEETQSTPAPTEKLKYLPEIHEVCERLASRIAGIWRSGVGKRRWLGAEIRPQTVRARRRSGHRSRRARIDSPDWHSIFHDARN